MRPSLKQAVVAALSLTVVASPAAASHFLAGVGTNSGSSAGVCSGPGGPFQGPSPVNASYACSGGGGPINGKASANFGHLGTEADAVYLAFDQGSVGMGSQAQFSDVVVFTSTDPSAQFADVSVNLLLHGALSGGPPGVGIASIGGFVNLGSGGASFHYEMSNAGFSASGGLVFLSGTVAPLMDALFRTPTVRVALNTPIGFLMDLEGAAVGAEHGGNAISSFGGSFKLPSDMDAFNLADGVTVNSGDWLVNNHFNDPLAAVVGVPEPASWILMLAGFGLAGAALRRPRTQQGA